MLLAALSRLVARPAPRVAEGRRPHGLLIALGVVAVLVAGGLVRLPHLPGLPFGEHEVDRSTPALLQAVADLEDYHAAKGSFQVVVDLEKDTSWVPSAISGERTRYLATGSVDAVVDFRGLPAGAVATTGDRRGVVFSLPHARLDRADVDLADSRVIGRDRGVVQRVSGMFSDSPTSEQGVAGLAEQRLDAAARGSDLQARAEQNTRSMLTGLAHSLGYTDVEVRFDAADGT